MMLSASPGLSQADTQSIYEHLANDVETGYLQQGNSDLQFVATERQGDQTVSVFQQTINRTPVMDAYVTVIETPSGELSVFDRGHSGLQLNSPEALIDHHTAEFNTMQRFHDLESAASTSELFWRTNDEGAGLLTWEVLIFVDGEVGDYSSADLIAHVDAVTGEIVNHGKPGTAVESLLKDPERMDGIYPYIVINDDIGLQGSQDYAAGFDAVAGIFDTTNDLICTGTLIDADTILTARHCGVEPGFTVRFGDNLLVPDHTTVIETVSNPGGGNAGTPVLNGADVTLAHLFNDVPSQFTPMRLIGEANDLVGRRAAIVGYGDRGVGSQGAQFADYIRRGGENVIDGYGAALGAAGFSTNIFSVDFDDGTITNNTIPGSPDPVTFEASAGPGDSGGPLLVQHGDEWVIAGVVSAGNTSNAVYGTRGWFTGTSNFQLAVQNAGGQFVGAANIGETGVASVTHNWQTINLQGNYTNPVVIAGAPTYNGNDAAVVRVRNVTANSFQIRIQEWDYLDGIHNNAESVGYLVVEEGSHGLVGGATLNAGTVNLNHDFQTVESGGNGVVLATVMSENGGAAVTTRIRNVGSNFDIRLQEEEANDGVHAFETVGWIQISTGVGSVNDQQFTAGNTGDVVRHTIFDLNYAPFAAPPVLLTEMQTMDGTDPAALRTNAVGTSQTEIFIQEEQSATTETTHTTEEVGFLAIEPGVITVGDATFGEVGTVAIDDQWTTVNLLRDYLDPVVVFGSIPLNGTDPATVRVRNVTSNSFEVRIQEWDYLNGTHAIEPTSYIVVEAGTNTLADGSTIVAGNQSGVVTIDQTVSFGSAFGSTAPVVMSQVTTVNGGAAVITRQRNVTTSGFRLRLQEEQAADNTHNPETVAWIAIEPGVGGMAHEVGRTGNSVTHVTSTINLTQTLGTTPSFLAQMQTADGSDPANVRHSNAGAATFDVFVQEERSADSETNHTTEVVGFFAFSEDGLLSSPPSGAMPLANGDFDDKVFALANANVKLSIHNIQHHDLPNAVDLLFSETSETDHQPSEFPLTHAVIRPQFSEFRDRLSLQSFDSSINVRELEELKDSAFSDDDSDDDFVDWYGGALKFASQL